MWKQSKVLWRRSTKNCSRRRGAQNEKGGDFVEKAINEIIGTGVIISPIVMILVEVMKKPKLISSQWLAPSACLVGILFAIVLSLTYPDLGSWPQLAISGIVAGAIASGVYTQTNLKK
mgnify:CR=1 FL=1